LLSSFMDRIMPRGTVVFGEVGLAGEVRRVSRSEARITESARLGFHRIIVPQSNVNSSALPEKVATVGVSRVGELASLLMDTDGFLET
jgi:DNA repair protein RadA/Sms